MQNISYFSCNAGHFRSVAPRTVFPIAVCGASVSICQKDYGRALADLSQAVRQQVMSVTLKQVPYGNSLKINVQPAVSGLTWTVNGKTVFFNQALPPGTVLNIGYLYSP